MAVDQNEVNALLEEMQDEIKLAKKLGINPKEFYKTDKEKAADKIYQQIQDEIALDIKHKIPNPPIGRIHFSPKQHSQQSAIEPGIIRPLQVRTPKKKQATTPDYAKQYKIYRDVQGIVSKGGNSEIYKKYAPQFQNLSNANAQRQEKNQSTLEVLIDKIKNFFGFETKKEIEKPKVQSKSGLSEVKMSGTSTRGATPIGVVTGNIKKQR